MKYTPTHVAGVIIVDLEPQRDHRGFSLRSFCSDEFADRGLVFDVVQTLIDNTEVSYHLSGEHVPAGEQGLRWNDPEFGVDWPLPVTVISEQDASWPARTPSLAPIERAASCLSR